MKSKNIKVHPERSRRVFVAMSGGVDSSVAAALLKNKGYDVVGVHMRCYNMDGCAEQDVEDARRAAEVLGIPFYVFDFEEEYRKKVVDYIVDGYREGITPNPDVMCNKEIKFGLFLDKALAMGADYVATGHYVRLRHSDTNIRIHTNDSNTSGKFIKPFVNSSAIRNWCRLSLTQAKDTNKDQSYFLWTLTQNQLKHCLFPIGDYLKPEVREMAREFGLPNADKKDSQGICFLGKVTLTDFLKDYIPEKRGMVLLAPSGVEGSTAEHKVIGEHRGAYFYTIGQRHGLGISNGKPAYIAEKNVKDNTIILAEGDDNPALYRREVTLTNVNFINPQHPYKLENVRMSVYARVRYRQPLAKAKLVVNVVDVVDVGNVVMKQLQQAQRYNKQSGTTFKVIFEQPQKFVAPGQSAVFYTKESNPSRNSGRRSRELRMLGGGIIA